MIDYLKYSGVSLCITFNPYHWAWTPIVRREEMQWDEDTFRASFLFLTLRIWIDDGSW